MRPLRVKIVAYRAAEPTIIENAQQKLLRLYDSSQVEFVDTQPDVIFFLSGGSERAAAEILEDGHFYVLLAHREGNSYASATEVKAYANQRGLRTILLDLEDSQTPAFMQHLQAVLHGVHALQGQRVGLVGEVSEWLIASSIEPSRLSECLGIHVQQIPWAQVADYRHARPASELLTAFAGQSAIDLTETAQVYTVLQELMRTANLQAITVECFPLVQEHHVTACLPLAKFNADGIPAGCEGDLVSIVGMMLAQAVTGTVPWIANTARVSDSLALFAHCTVAPNLIQQAHITTHFETGQGTAVQGDFIADEITLFRLDQTLQQAFLTSGRVVTRPRYHTACRTQIEVQLPPSAVHALRERPLGNHHLILPGDQTARLALACQVLGLDL